MITVEDLTVKVTYTVGLSNVEMAEDVYEQLLKAADEGKSLDPTCPSSIVICLHSITISGAFEA